MQTNSEDGGLQYRAVFDAEITFSNGGALQAQRFRNTLSDAPAWLESAGVVASAQSIMRAKAALAYQPWRTVWESARAVVGTTGPREYERMLRSVFGQIPVHLIAGEHSTAEWHVPGWARKAAATDTVIPSVGHMMMLEDPHRFGAALAAVLT